MISPSTLTSSPLRTGLLAYGIVTGALIAYNVRWTYVGDLIWGAKPKKLPIARRDATDEKKKRLVVVLLHGMWHDASWYSNLQKMLKERGYSSYAVDLLPGQRALPGFSQKEIVADLEATLLPGEEDVDYVLVGHSQGGLVVQSCLLNSPQLKARTKAVVLLGTYPLGLVPPLVDLLKEPRNMYNQWGYAGICLTGKLISLDYLQHIFLLPTTNLDSLTEYTTKLMNAPSDGLITMSHFPQSVGVLSTKPALVLGAQQDIIYPPHLLQKDFDQRFPNAVHKTIPNQAHCFMDGGTQMESTLLEWLDQVVENLK